MTSPWQLDLLSLSLTLEDHFVCIYTSQDLVDEHFDVILCELLWGDNDLVEVTLHQRRYNVTTEQRTGAGSTQQGKNQNVVLKIYIVLINLTCIPNCQKRSATFAFAKL